MTEVLQIIVGFLFLILVYIGTQILVSRKMRRAALQAIRDLKQKGALGPESAMSCPTRKRTG